jgi:purine nucleosidase
MDRVPVLLDTDIGGDIDDAVCLAYLLRQPRCELLGVTTVSGQPGMRAMMVDAMCREAGVEVPIHAGTDDPLVVEPRQTEVPQARALARWRHARVFPHDTAIPFMAEMIRSRPGEVTLLTIGPLTNAALLFEAEPDVAGQLDQLVMMCGMFGEVEGRKEEWNALLDPHALAAVYRAGVPRVTTVGYDVTFKVRMDASEFRERFKGGLLDTVASFAEVWFESRKKVTFHDPLAGAVIFEPDICTYGSGTVTVETEAADALGRTTLAEREGGSHRVATDVDVKRFFDHYFDVVRAG